jgi:G patch domain/KOW motif-containing protein
MGMLLFPPQNIHATFIFCMFLCFRSIKKAPKKELVIPLITKNRWRTPGNDTKTENTEASDLDKQAEKEILQETLKAVDGWENRGNGVPSNIDIPLFMQNRVPSGFETDEKVDVSLRADQVLNLSTILNYLINS